MFEDVKARIAATWTTLMSPVVSTVAVDTALQLTHFTNLAEVAVEAEDLAADNVADQVGEVLDAKDEQERAKLALKRKEAATKKAQAGLATARTTQHLVTGLAKATGTRKVK